MALTAANLTPRFVTDLRLGFSLISSGNHAIAYCGHRHSPPSLTIARCHSGRAPEEVPLSSHSNFLSSFDRVAARRLCLNIKSGNLVSMASFKPKSSELEMGQADGFENSMELPELDADLNPAREFLDIDRGPSEDNNFHELSIQDCQTKLKTRKDVQAADTLAIEALATRFGIVIGFHGSIYCCRVAKKLCAKKFPPEIVDNALSGLKMSPFPDRNGHHYFEWPRRIKQVLLRIGVSEADADKATKQIFTDEDCDQVPFLGMSKESVNRLLKQALKQWMKGENVPPKQEKLGL